MPSGDYPAAPKEQKHIQTAGGSANATAQRRAFQADKGGAIRVSRNRKPQKTDIAISRKTTVAKTDGAATPNDEKLKAAVIGVTR